MSRLFGIAGIQMSVVPWDVNATVDKMSEIVTQVAETLPWVQMLVFHELVLSGVAQFIPARTAEPWKQSAESIPGPLSDRLCTLARQTGKWLVPGSMYEVQGESIYNSALVISPSGDLISLSPFPFTQYYSRRDSSLFRTTKIDQ